MYKLNTNLAGLSPEAVLTSRTTYGENKIEILKHHPILIAVQHAVKEPMLLLLGVASTLYFIHGDLPEGIFLLVAIILVWSISYYQESRSRNALDALKSLTQPKSKVIRDNIIAEIPREDLVVGDLIIVEEGALIPADATIVQSNDFTVNESILTGESLSIAKNETPGMNIIYQGSFVVSGLAICKVTTVGIQTRVGQIGKSIEDVKKVKSPLQIQIGSFVNTMAAVGLVIFLVIWIVNIYQTELIVESLLNSLTLAMSILPEEIPVAFATFMALGAWRLMQLGIIVKDTKTVETLGGATVICIDKTGTITKNEMALDKIYVFKKNQILTKEDSAVKEVVTVAMWGSEPIPFDPMEKSIHNTYGEICDKDLRPDYKLVKEYPLGGNPPFMTHIFQNEIGDALIASKGAPEAILSRSKLSPIEKATVWAALEKLVSQGYRVLGVGSVPDIKEYPETQDKFQFEFKGFLAFYDPPKDNIKDVLKKFYRAGIKVNIITGDNSITTATIAKQIDFLGAEKSITGDEILSLNEKELNQVVAQNNIFARMFPDAKLRVIQALQSRSEIVAMTGDGVNDGPALKAANIGIAMGQKGSEIAKQASAIVLADDNLQRMVDAIEMGRKIYNNLKKAIQYIISIHIPIILIVFLPLVLGWIYPVIFSPVHVIFLELIMGPTCSIIYENEPIEQNAMEKKPRNFTKSFFNISELSTSIVQGLVITAGLFGVYWYAIHDGNNLPTTTSMIFLSLISANIALTLVNRSFYYSIATTIRYVNNLIPIVIGVTLLLVVMIYLIVPFREFFRFGIPSPGEVAVSIIIGFLSAIWFEGYKFFKRRAVSDKMNTFSTF
jgi:P-type Ca2+ transporter type 2C